MEFYFSDYILALLSSIAVLDLGDMALEYTEGSQESGLISVWQYRQLDIRSLVFFFLRLYNVSITSKMRLVGTPACLHVITSLCI